MMTYAILPSASKHQFGIIVTNAMIRYIQFYLELIATSDNVSLLYHLAMKCKTVRDSESHTHTEASNSLFKPAWLIR